MGNWNGLMRVDYVRQWEGGRLVWGAENVHNLLHAQGEAFIISAVFTGGTFNAFIPSFYYIGLDNRGSVSRADTLASLIDEPTVNGYARQAVASSGEFTVVVDSVTGFYKGVSPILTFQANGGSWGPVSNIFLTDATALNGNLISTAVLPNSIVLSDQQSITMRISLLLHDCPVT